MDGEEGIPLTGVDIIVGSDPSLAAVPIEDPSIDGMHARLIRQVDGDYLIRDQDSKAGTWVNFEPLPEEGKRLEHGDLIQFGATKFRFQLTDPPPARIIRTKSTKEDNDDDTIVPEVGS
jgi:pSer/pThr/pTyr-binding forkhead associated (FHA) protein